MVEARRAATVTHVIKRSGHSQPYRETKLHASIIRACLAAKAFEGEAVFVADRVVHGVTAWTDDKAEITFRDLRVQVLGALSVLHPAAAYAYDIHDVTL